MYLLKVGSSNSKKTATLFKKKSSTLLKNNSKTKKKQDAFEKTSYKKKNSFEA